MSIGTSTIALGASDLPLPVGSDQTRGPHPEQGDVQAWHRVLTVLAVIGLFTGIRPLWNGIEGPSPHLAFVVTCSYAGLMACGVLALTARTRRALTRIDLAVLLLAIVIVLCQYYLNHAGTDEGQLTAQAATQVLHGHPIYGQSWPWVFKHVVLTPTMSGGGDYTYAYPPLSALLTAPVHALWHSTASATLVTTAFLIATAVLLWIMLPAQWRSLATLTCLSLGVLPSYARDGYPALIALFFLVPVIVRFHLTGQGGRLGRRGTIAALCLGVACGAQQLPWFLAPFLLVTLYALRRGELGPRSALAVVARYTGLAVLGWIIADAFCLVTEPVGLVKGMLLPFSQHAVPHGQGLMGISYYLTSGSSRLGYYAYAGDLLLLGLLAATVLFVRRLGAAVTVLPWLAFYLEIRSQDGYYVLMTPLWIAAAATVPMSAFSHAWQPRLPRLLRSRTARVLLAGALLVPATASTAIAATSTAPLRMHATAHWAASTGRTLTSVDLTVTNRTNAAITPHFTYRYGTDAWTFWTATSGPATLPAHASAHYVLTPPHGKLKLGAASGGRNYLVVFSDAPQTVSSTVIPLVAHHH
ncbi:hypothetical protein ACEZCY_31225 [Streptacidiphilus sp. N1-12]|uniref:Uncharacterized protein n=2 Tax=Streptacidiphilus alkalitolerans TaxID=3342712 RepID=A0ABV6VJ61_9ACTN